MRERESTQSTQPRSYAGAASGRQQSPPHASEASGRQQSQHSQRCHNPHHSADGRRNSSIGHGPLRPLRPSRSAEIIARLRQELVDARAGFEQRLAAEQRRAEMEKSDAIKHIEHLRANLQELEGRNHGLRSAAQAQYERANKAQADCKDMRQLLDARTAELASAQAFMGPADALSERDVANEVEALNEEIFQLSSLLAEDVQYVAPDEGSANARASVSKRIGGAICGMLIFDDEGVRLNALQLALQATATRWIQQRVKKWSCIDKEPAVARRWEVVTLKSTLASEKKGLNELSASLRDALITVFLVSGCVPREAVVGADMLQTFGESIDSVVRLFHQLRSDINIGVTSSELRTVVPRPDSQYDSNSMEAEDAGQQHEGGSVGCGLTLGLMRVSDGSKGHTLVKPKVIHAASFAAAA
ncbi:hypothetical protein GGF50DRAFT_50328 [Schizophyllum commune]